MQPGLVIPPCRDEAGPVAGERNAGARIALRSQEGPADSGSTDASRVIWHLSPSVIATALARRHRTGSLGRVEVTDRDGMPLGLHHPRAEARRAEAVPDPSAAGVVHEAAGQRDTASRAVARDKPGDYRWSSRD